jgi:ketosteroid isomerase-like protein
LVKKELDMNETENTKVVQDAYARFGSGDVDGLVNHMAENASWTTPVVANSPLGGKRVGSSAVREFFTLLPQHENMTVFQPREFIAQGDKVVVLGNFTATVVSTGRTYSSEWIHVFTLSDGKITSFLEMFDNAAAERAFQKADTA